MYYVYLIKGKEKVYYYTGCTNDLKKRFILHNKGEIPSTKPYMPFEIIYYEACLNEKDAYNREKYLKSRQAKSFLKKRLQNWFETNNNVA